MKAKHVLSIAELGPESLSKIVDQAMTINRGYNSRLLEGKMVGIYFRKSSTRTRTSFTVAAHKLGGEVIAYGPNDLQLVTGESVEDTARVLSSFLDMLVVRTNDSIEEMRALAAQSKMSIINAMSDNEHPTQAIADLVTICEAFGRLNGVHLLYIGEGNNTAAALALAVSMTPDMRLTIVTPEGYGVQDTVLELASRFAQKSGSLIEQHHDPDSLPPRVDAVYTSRWETMGVIKADSDWREKFRPYSVTQKMMARVSKPNGTIFLHDLPAVRGSEVVNEVLDGRQSLAFRQAAHKLTAALAVLSWCAAPYEEDRKESLEFSVNRICEVGAGSSATLSHS
jgi:ornithine carbamoyltransferase